MTYQDVADLLHAEVLSGRDKLTETAATSGYASDMLSDVMAKAQAGQLWFTIQTHPNVIAVALLLNLGAVVITGAHQPEPELLAKAETEGMVVMTTKLTTYEAINYLTKAGF